MKCKDREKLLYRSEFGNQALEDMPLSKEGFIIQQVAHVWKLLFQEMSVSMRMYVSYFEHWRHDTA